MKNKRGQLDNPMVIFAVIVIALLLIAPIILKVMRSIQQPVSSAFGNLSNGGAVAQKNFNTVINTGITFWDKIVIAFFIFAVLLLFVSAFLVDAHPFFIIFYVLLNLFLILFAPNIIKAADNIYESAIFAQEVAYLSFMDTVRTNYGTMLVGFMITTAIIIYGKVTFFRAGTGGTRR